MSDSTSSVITPHRGIEPLKQYPQWILWALAGSDKIPLSANTLEVGDTHAASFWTDYKTAFAVSKATGYKMGFVFTKNDPFYFLDIDHCVQNGEMTPIAVELLSQLQGAAVGYSSSGTGLHVFGRANVTDDRRVKEANGLFELYTHGRFVALAGESFNGDADSEHSTALSQIVNRYLPPRQRVTDSEWRNEPVEDWCGYESDDDLIAHALRSKSAASLFGGGVSFKDLWEANETALSSKWPSSNPTKAWDYNRADAALAQHLAFWTGNNSERIQDLMCRSALYRDKYEREDYLPRTITVATSMQTKFHQIPKKEDSSGELRAGMQYLTVPNQIKFFDGCVYVQALHKVWTSKGMLLKPEQFKVIFGGYIFALDALGEKTTKDAWEAFTQNRGYHFPKVFNIIFRPGMAPGEIYEDKGLSYVNTYFDRRGEPVAGDIAPFLSHVEKLLPDENDREILLSYLAACVQKIGTKFQWAVCLQGVQGNGKTFFYSALEYALGQINCHLVDPKDLKESNFNAWIERKLLVGIEEIRTGGKYDLADRLKPLITNERVPIQGKGSDQATGDNIANFLFFSNHKDAVLKTIEDRRYCVFYTAQQSLDDLLAAGMDDDYFEGLYKWAKNGGYAHIAKYLSERPINVRVRGRAPITTSTDEATRESLGALEQLFLECIDLEMYGFRDDFIIYSEAKMIASKLGKHSPKIISSALNNLNYVKHPALNNSDGKFQFNGFRTRIYVKKLSQNYLKNYNYLLNYFKIA